MLMRILTAFLVSLLAVAVAAWAGVRLHRLGIRPVRRLLSLARGMSVLGWCMSIVLLGVFGMRGGEKLGGGLRSSSLPLGDGWEDMPPITSTNTDRTLTADDFRHGFVMTRICTNETFDFSAPAGATVCADWLAFGAAEDWTYADVEWRMENAGWGLSNGTTRLRLFSSGKVELLDGIGGGIPTNVWFAPLAAPLGIAPEANWHLVGNGEGGTGNGEGGMGNGWGSQFWHLVTPSNTLQLTWQNALYGRDAGSPVSVQMEAWPDGRFSYRYDLTNVEWRKENGELDVAALSNIVIGASIGSLPLQSTLVDIATNPFSILHSPFSIHFHPLSPVDAADPDRDGDGLATIDELFVHFTDPGNPDTDFDGMSDSCEVAGGTSPVSRDADGDGLVDASDPDPWTYTPPDDLDGDGIPDAYETYWFGGTNVYDAADVRDTTGFTLAGKMLGGVNPTNAVAEMETVLAGSLVSWRLFGPFAADWPASASNVVWERTFAIDRSSAWQQFFVSASPTNAAGWSLRGMALEWETGSGDSGSVSASPVGDSFRIPLSAECRTSSLTLRLVSSGPGLAYSPATLHLLAFAPSIRRSGATEIAGNSGARFVVLLDGSDSSIGLSVDMSGRPCRAPPGADESDMSAIDGMESSGADGPSFDGGASGGTFSFPRPGVYELPEIESVLPLPRARSGSGGPLMAVVLDPSARWSCTGGWRSDGLSYGWGDGWYYVADTYPLDSPCLRGGWYRDWGGELDPYECTLSVSGGLGGEQSLVTVDDDGETGRVYVDGVEVWSATPEHVHDDGTFDAGVAGDRMPGAADGESDGGSGGCGACGGCESGSCDSLEGTDLGSVKFRIPLGFPARDRVAGFVWFASDGPASISKSSFQLLAYPSATVSDTTSSGTRRIVCGDVRGRDLRIEDVANGARVTIYDAAAQTLEHVWELTNDNGDPARIRLRKISRLGNVMSDETFSYSGGEWTRFDNVAGVGTRLETYDDFADLGDGERSETRTTTDARGNVLSSVTTVRSRVGECDSAVLRETYRLESTGNGWKWSRAEYWDDPRHPARHGLPRLVWGSARAWVYTDYDVNGHETLRVRQRNGAEMPSAFPAIAADGTCDMSMLQDAFVTVRSYEPPPGDSCHADDAGRPRIETRYVVVNGSASVVGITRFRYTRLQAGGYAAVKEERWRDLAGGAGTAFSYRTFYDANGTGTPLLMRNALAESLGEDGILAVSAYSLSDGALTCETRRYGPSLAQFPTYETTVADAAYGTVLRRTTRLTDGDAAIADEQSVYDSQNRLRSTAYLDGTSLTNAYSCCRLLWKRDRDGRKVLRSAMTGTDHLYNAMEDVWLSDISTNGQYRVTQHFYDALGRETNTVTYAGTTPGEATVASASGGKACTATTTSYPYGGDGYAVRTDERGRTAVASVVSYEDREETVETVSTNGTAVLSETTTSVRNGPSAARRAWTGAWREDRRFEDYSPDGSRIAYAVTESSDNGVVTNSVSTYDLLGRLVTVATPCTAPGGSQSSATAITSNSYDGTSSRILESTYTAGDIVRTTTYLYNDWGEQVGTVLDGVTNRTDTTYETDSSNIVWRVVTATVIGPTTNSLTITRTRLTGLSDACRRHTIELVGRAASCPPPGDSPSSATVTETLVAFDPATGIETETVTSSIAPTIVRRYLHGVLLSTETNGETTFNSYDAFGRLAATSRTGVQPVPAGATGTTDILSVASYSYSPNGDLLAAHTYTNGDEVVSEFYSYDMLGNRISTTDALGNAIYRTYDPLGNVLAEWGATYPVLYTYDTAGRRTSMTTFRDAGGSRPVATDGDTTTWAYDARTSLCLSKTYADGSTVAYTYTPDNLPLRTTYASGKWKENVYDSQRRLTGMLYSSPDMDYEIQNDAYGNATNVQDAAGNIWRHVYSFNSKMLDEMFIQGDGVTGVQGATYFVAATNNIVRAYDSFDRPTGYALAVNGETKGGISYAYDAHGRISRITATNSAGRAFSVAYTNVAGYNCGYTITTPNGSTIRRIVERDEFRRNLVTNCATHFNSALVDSNLYAFDALSRPTTRRTGTTDVSSVDAHFAYNNRSEVVSAAIGSNIYAHGYDDIGNHVLFSDNLTTNTFTHNALNQMVGRDAPIAPPTTFAYTPDGGLSFDGTWNYSYDAEDQLASITSSSLTNGAIRVLNAYDYRRRRISKTVQRLSVTTAPPPSPPVETYEWNTIEYRTFAYDNWNLIYETITAIYGGTTNVSEVQYFWGLDLSDTLQGAGGVVGLLAVSSNGQYYFPTYDNNGNVTKYIDESGNVVAAYEYDDFGRVISQIGPLAYFFRHRFSTKYFDVETGLYYYGYRFYSSDWHIWLNRDPIGERGGLNLCTFCNNAQLFKIDADGYSIFNYIPFTSTLLSAIENYLGHIPGSSVTDYSFVSPKDCRCDFTGAEEQCIEKVERETLRYIVDNLSSAALARVTDFIVFAGTLRADFRVSATFFADGVLGAAINAHIYSKIMDGANKAKSENCSCSQYGY